MNTANKLRAIARESREASKAAQPGPWEAAAYRVWTRKLPRTMIGSMRDHMEATHIAHHSPTRTARTAAILEWTADAAEWLEEDGTHYHSENCRASDRTEDNCYCGVTETNKRLHDLLAKLAKVLEEK